MLLTIPAAAALAVSVASNLQEMRTQRETVVTCSRDREIQTFRKYLR